MNARTATLAVLLSAGALAAGPLTLREAVERTQDSPAVQQAARMEEAVRYLVELDRRAFWPTAGLDGSYQRLHKDPGFVIPAGALGNLVPMGLVVGEKGVGQFGVGVEQLLWDFGQSLDRIRSRKALLEAAGWQTTGARQEMERQIVGAYLNLQLADRLGAVAQALKDDFGENARVAEELYKQGMATKADHLAAASARERAEVAVLQAEKAKVVARKLLAILIGGEVDEAAPVEGLPPEEGDAGGWAAAAYERRPELLALKAQRESMVLEAKALDAMDHPRVTASAGYAFTDDSYQLHQNNTALRLSLTVPLFDGGRSGLAARAKAAEAEGVAAREEQARRGVALEVTALLETAKEARATVAWAGRSADHAREVVNLTRYRYEQGLAAQREVLDAVADREAAETLLERARVTLLTARSDLYRACGLGQEKFLEELGQ